MFQQRGRGRGGKKTEIPENRQPNKEEIKQTN